MTIRLELQPKLLRAVKEKELEPLGGGRRLRDARIIAATNLDLWQMVYEKKFRADLYYRLNVFPIGLPPLREPREDIPLLVAHFVEEFSKQQGKTIDAIPEDVMAALEQHNSKGNIREPQNVIERGVLMTADTVLSRHTTERSHEVALVAEPAVPQSMTIKALADMERSHITAVLRETNWVVAGPRGAAAQLGVSRTTLMARMQRLGISSGTLRRRSAARLVNAIAESSSCPTDNSPDGLRVIGAVAGNLCEIPQHSHSPNRSHDQQ